MTTLIDPNLADNTDSIGSRLARIDPDNFRSQSGAAMEDGDDETDDDLPDDEPIERSYPADDEPIGTDGDPTGEHDQDQDDNYAPGGHVTRTSAG